MTAAHKGHLAAARGGAGHGEAFLVRPAGHGPSLALTACGIDIISRFRWRIGGYPG
jgi:hypothetical protein